MMRVCDRGTKKWVSLMLPEHVEMLDEVFVERKEKPKLDEQQMIEIDQKLKYALNEDVNLEMTYYDNGNYETVRGKLNQINQWQGYIVLLNEDGVTISLSNIIDVEVC